MCGFKLPIFHPKPYTFAKTIYTHPSVRAPPEAAVETDLSSCTSSLNPPLCNQWEVQSNLQQAENVRLQQQAAFLIPVALGFGWDGTGEGELEAVDSSTPMASSPIKNVDVPMEAGLLIHQPPIAANWFLLRRVRGLVTWSVVSSSVCSPRMRRAAYVLRQGQRCVDMLGRSDLQQAG